MNIDSTKMIWYESKVKYNRTSNLSSVRHSLVSFAFISYRSIRALEVKLWPGSSQAVTDWRRLNQQQRRNGLLAGNVPIAETPNDVYSASQHLANWRSMMKKKSERFREGCENEATTNKRQLLFCQTLFLYRVYQVFRRNLGKRSDYFWVTFDHFWSEEFFRQLRQ